MAFQVARLVASGFRGVNLPLDLALSPGLTVVVGPNGAGKSTLIQAVEWALFGTLPEAGHAEYRREDAAVNAFSSQSRAQVRLTLHDGERALIVERTRRLGRSTTARSDLLVRSDGRVWRDSAGQEMLEQMLRLTVAEFHASVLLRQDASRSLAGAEHEARSATIDRLLGIADLRELNDNLSISQVSREVNRAARELEAQRGAGLTAALELRRLLSQREDALAARRIDAARLSPRGLETLLTQMEADLAPVLSDLELPPLDRQAAPPGRLAEIQGRLPQATRRREESLRWAYERRSQLAIALAGLENAAQAPGEVGDPLVPAASDVQAEIARVEDRLVQLRRQRDQWERLQRQEAAAGTALAAAQEHLRALTARRDVLGDAGTIDRLQSELEALTAEGKRQGAQARLIGEALEALQGTDAKRCPVCGQPVSPSALVQHLQSAGGAGREMAQLEQLRQRYRRVDEQRRRLQEAMRELEAARAEVAARQHDLEDVAAAMAALRSADPQAVPNAELERDRPPLESRLAALEQERDALRDFARHREQERRNQQARHAALRAAIGTVARELSASDDTTIAELQQEGRKRQETLERDLASLNASGSKLTSLTAGVQEATAILEYLDLKANIERLESSRPEDEKNIVALQAVHDQLDRLHAGLQAIQAAAVGLSEARLQRAQGTIMPLANQYFDRLGSHPTYSALALQPQMQRGASLYALLAHDSDLEHATFLTTRLSHTQMHIAALAIFLALAAHPLHRLGFLLLDDPAQSMDTERRQALAAVLAREASDRQVLVTTEDGAFRDALLAAAPEGTRVLQLGAWRRDGIQVIS